MKKILFAAFIILIVGCAKDKLDDVKLQHEGIDETEIFDFASNMKHSANDFVTEDDASVIALRFVSNSNKKKWLGTNY